MAYSIAGIVLALGVALLAWRRSRGAGGFYDREVYGMERATHRRYAIASLAFAAFFLITCAARWRAAGIAGLALYALIAVLYAASFLQGAPDRDE
ncbi:MAG: hypothetical protein JO190_09520 [Candidatus Eremiobacteraeota bacterium]|nr:hypothetical protein [Candidatus Eremiobacteraeota bacterium]MBV8499835.1 hypothetical protein [Candidatus Eremiobacteraeota bacterium]